MGDEEQQGRIVVIGDLKVKEEWKVRKASHPTEIEFRV